MIETAIKEDLFLDKKLIIPKNKLDAIRIMNELHPVVGGQPTHEKDQPNDNNPLLDLACTLANIHASGVGEHADLRPIQNEPPSFFYGEGFISGISSLKGNGILAIFGHWRDGSGNYAIKQFYYTDKEISYRNAVSEDKWGAWIDVLTSNSQLDYNKLLNVPITSTLSDDKNKIASIYTVNEVNRKVNTAQTTANNADAKALAAQKTADTGVVNAKIADDKAGKAQTRADAAFTRIKPIAEGGTGATTIVNARLNLGLKGAALVDLTSTLSDAKDLAASIFSVNEINRKVNTAQKTADDAHSVLVQKLDTSKVKTTLSTSIIDVPAMKLLSDLRYELLSKEEEIPVDQIFTYDTPNGIPPKGKILRNGQAIDPVAMPKLYARYGTHMPDDRDRVHRMSGSLAGNAGGTQEDAIRNITGEIKGVDRSDSPSPFDLTGVFYKGTMINKRSVTINSNNYNNHSWSFDVSRVVPTATENRVKSRIVIFCNKIQ